MSPRTAGSGLTAALAAITVALLFWGPQEKALAQEAAPATATTSQKSAHQDWPLARGDAESTGAAAQTLSPSLEVMWEFKADEAIESTPTIVGDLVFVADVMGQLYALGRDDGQVKWRQDYDTGFLASPSIRDDLLVIGDVEGKLYALDAQSGKERWQQSTDGEIHGAATFHQDHVLAASQDGTLYCFAAQDGTLVWKYETDDQIRCSPTIAGDRTFLGGCDGQLHVVDLATGKAIGQPLPLGGPTGSTPAVAGSKAFLPIMDGLVLAFDWKNSQQLWEYQDDALSQEYRASAAVAADRVVVSSKNRQVDAISISTGERLWRYTLRRRADASPVIAGDDVWIASTDGRLIRLSLENGEEKWIYEIRGAFLAGPAIAGDSLYIADDAGIVRRFGPAKR